VRLDVHYYETPAGRDLIAEFLDSLDDSAAAKCLAVIGWLESGEIDQHPKARGHLDGPIWEIRVRHAGEQYRFLYAIEGGRAYLLVPLHKKTQKIDRRDIERAKERFQEIIRRGASG
jgi:phage-related protein